MRLTSTGWSITVTKKEQCVLNLTIPMTFYQCTVTPCTTDAVIEFATF